MSNRGPWRLVTVNTSPERAAILIERTVKLLQDRYDIEHIANCQRIEEVRSRVMENKPNILFCASMWTSEEAEQIFSIARQIVPDIKTHAIPTGLQVERGPDAVVEYLSEVIPRLLG